MPEFYNLNQFKRGWFIGNFQPSILRTREFEVSIISHKMNEETFPHFHRASTEINVVVQGTLMVNGHKIETGDIFVYHAFEVSNVRFLTDSVLCVVRVPSAPDDKVHVKIEDLNEEIQ